MELEPVHLALRALLDPRVVSALAAPSRSDDAEAALASAERHVTTLLEEARRFLHRRSVPSGAASEPSAAIGEAVREFGRRVRAARGIAALEREFQSPWPVEAREVLPTAEAGPPGASRAAATAPETPGAASAARSGGAPRTPRAALWGTVLAWCAVEAVARLSGPAGPAQTGVRLFDTLRLRRPMAEAFEVLGLDGEERWRAAARLRVSFAEAHRVATQPATGVARIPGPRLDPDVAWLIGVHEAQGTVYYVKEPFERLLWWLALPALLALAAEPLDRDAVRALEREIAARARAAAEAGYRLDRV
jgi:hypothetical protein